MLHIQKNQPTFLYVWQRISCCSSFFFDELKWWTKSLLFLKSILVLYVTEKMMMMMMMTIICNSPCEVSLWVECSSSSKKVYVYVSKTVSHVFLHSFTCAVLASANQFKRCVCFSFLFCSCCWKFSERLLKDLKWGFVAPVRPH